MKKNSRLYGLLAIVALIFIGSSSLSGCYLTSQLIPVPSVSITVPGDRYAEGPNSYNGSAPLPVHVQFETVVGSKVWYTRIQDDGSYNRRSQTKLRFNTGSKTFTKEIYYWERIGNSTTYRSVGKDVQNCRYYYTPDNNKLEYEVMNSYNGGLKSVWYSIDNAEMITFEGKQYISRQALANQSVVDYTTRRDITLNY